MIARKAPGRPDTPWIPRNNHHGIGIGIGIGIGVGVGVGVGVGNFRKEKQWALHSRHDDYGCSGIPRLVACLPPLNEGNCGCHGIFSTDTILFQIIPGML
jgi:hypothetical protein